MKKVSDRAVKMLLLMAEKPKYIPLFIYKPYARKKLKEWLSKQP